VALDLITIDDGGVPILSVALEISDDQITYTTVDSYIDNSATHMLTAA